jgi:hypothetical protein
MQPSLNPVIIKLAPSEYRHLAKLAELRDQTLSDLVRELLRLPPESQVDAAQLPPTRHLRIIGGG